MTSSPTGDGPRRIIIDTDPGIDDAMAIVYALAAPELDVIGLTTASKSILSAIKADRINALFSKDTEACASVSVDRVVVLVAEQVPGAIAIDLHETEQEHQRRQEEQRQRQQ